MAHFAYVIFAPVLGLVTQAQENPFTGRIPGWVWLLGSLLVVIIGVIWTLWEESETQKKLALATPAEPVPTPVEVVPAAVIAQPAPIFAPVSPPPVPVPAPPSRAAVRPKPDDLKDIIGIGPKIAQILNEQGIFTFDQLATAEVSFLERLLEEREWHMADPSTWPAQARDLAEKKRVNL